MKAFKTNEDFKNWYTGAWKQQDAAENKERLEQIRAKANKKLFAYGWKNGLTKAQTRRKYQEIMLIDDDLQFSLQVEKLTL